MLDKDAHGCNMTKGKTGGEGDKDIVCDLSRTRLLNALCVLAWFIVGSPLKRREFQQLLDKIKQGSTGTPAQPVWIR